MSLTLNHREPGEGKAVEGEAIEGEACFDIATHLWVAGVHGLSGCEYNALSLGLLRALTVPDMRQAAGAHLVLRAYEEDGKTFSGAWCVRRITYRSRIGCLSGYVTLSVNGGAENEWAKHQLLEAQGRYFCEGGDLNGFFEKLLKNSCTCRRACG